MHNAMRNRLAIQRSGTASPSLHDCYKHYSPFFIISTISSTDGDLKAYHNDLNNQTKHRIRAIINIAFHVSAEKYASLKVVVIRTTTKVIILLKGVTHSFLLSMRREVVF